MREQIAGSDAARARGAGSFPGTYSGGIIDLPYLAALPRAELGEEFGAPSRCVSVGRAGAPAWFPGTGSFERCSYAGDIELYTSGERVIAVSIDQGAERALDGPRRYGLAAAAPVASDEHGLEWHALGVVERLAVRRDPAGGVQMFAVFARSEP
jgi:hypothetical protein